MLIVVRVEAAAAAGAVVAVVITAHIFDDVDKYSPRVSVFVWRQLFGTT